ncbi:MAG: hypothetical protein AAF456_09740 [Planctomycetota bacterium]
MNSPMSNQQSYKNVILFSFACIVASMNAGCTTVVHQEVVPPQYVDAVNAPTNVFLSPRYSEMRPSRIAIVLPQNRLGNFLEQDVFARQLATELSTAGIADTVVASGPTTCRSNTIERGVVDAYELTEVARMTSADAVLYIDVTSVSPYAPLSASVSMALVDTRESVVLMTINNRWSLDDPATSRSYRLHQCRRNEQDGFASDIYSHSPTSFLEFTAADLTRYLSTIR